MIDFALLASGSKGNCFYIQDGETKVLIDCGTTKKYLTTSLQKLNLTFDDIDALVVTHDHSDHVSQIRFFANTEIHSPVEIPGVDVFLVRPLQEFVVGSLKFTPIPLSHDAANTTGYIIEDGFDKLVYITDTGYVHERYIPMLMNADYIVMESNHDVDMLMHTRRPQYLKQRIYGDNGHLNNEDCAALLTRIVSANTKSIILAHISQEANTRDQALVTSQRALMDVENERMNLGLVLAAAGQYEIIRKGVVDEEVDYGTVRCSFGR